MLYSVTQRLGFQNFIFKPRLLKSCVGFCGTNHPNSNFHSSTSLASLPSKTDLLQHSTDYGKYYVPGKWDSMYSWFVDSGLVRTVEAFLINVHDFTGLPWWATIIVCTVALRGTITAPLYLWQTHKLIKHKMLEPLLQKVAERVNLEADLAAKEHNWNKKTRDMHAFNSFYKHRRKIYKQHKIPGMMRRYMLPYVQLPLWFSVSASLRHLTLSLPFITSVTVIQSNIFTSLSHEGALWFTNLCIPDPYFVLPVLCGVVNLAVIEVHRGDGKTPLIGVSKILINFVQIISLMMIPISSYMPSAVVLYWVTSSTFGLVQALAMQSIRVKQFLRFPISEHHSKTPYRDILSRFTKFPTLFSKK